MTQRTNDEGGSQQLGSYSSKGFDRGRSALVELAWLVIEAILVAGPIPGSAMRVGLLRAFGAKIGKGAVIKPRVRVKFPWRLSVGDHCWIGEGAWIDNLAEVILGSNVSVSQGAYLCTGSHDWSRPDFSLITRRIEIFDHAWIAAKTIVGPGVTVGEGAVLSLGSVATRDLAAWTVHQGVPAIPLSSRAQSDRPEYMVPSLVAKSPG